MSSYTRETSKTFACGPSPRLDIRTVNGPIRVRGQDREDVYVVARVRYRADNDDDAEAVMSAVEAGIYADGDLVTVRSPDLESHSFFDAFRSILGSHRHFELDLEVFAPRACSLSLQHENGRVQLKWIGGDARVHMVNGRFEAMDIGGALDVHQVNGRCDIENVAGAVSVYHTNGAIGIENSGGNIDLRLVNGSVEVVNPRASVNIKGVGGAYTLQGAVHGDVTISNSHGRITLNLTRDSRFHLDAESEVGTVTSELEVRDNDLQATHSALPRVHLRSQTGKIELRALRHGAREAAVVY